LPTLTTSKPTTILQTNTTNTTHTPAVDMSAIQQNVEAASAAYSASFTQGHLALPPAKQYLVLTCMDARIDPARAFGIDLGDAHVIRNVSPPLPPL
jgi:carbonic anhydrase